MDDLWVLVIDDGRGGSFYDPLFDENARRRTELGLKGRLRRYGVIRQTPQGARAGVLDALNDGIPIDLVLLDHVLTDGGHPPREVRAGVRLMTWMRKEYEARAAPLPACVLWTAEYSPNLAYTFLQSGGRHAFPHTRPLAEVAQTLWAIAAGELTWEPRPRPPTLALTPTDLALLPYLEADRPNHEIAEELSDAEGRRLTAETVGQRRRNLIERVNARRRELGLEEIVGSNPTTRVTDFARDQGHVWVPLGLRNDVR